MLKQDELTIDSSCLNRANANEMLFVILERDVAASETIRYWCMMRIKHNKNKEDDDQIKEALMVADYIEMKQRADSI